ncbi:MAG: LysE family transporter [Porphyromonas sp.]|nr:LysE family transporter [Porphyromonas sp.]
MLITLLKGIIIGIIISAPLGPVGVLCLRETLHGGRREGLLTGLGAALSDVLYGLVVYFGVGMVLDFVIAYDAHLRLLGGIIIVGFALFLYQRSKKEIKQTPTVRFSKRHGLRKVITAFVVTATNPFIMLLILPLYTRFQFVRETPNPGWELSTALLGLAIGCMTWWYILTLSVQTLATRTGHAGVRVISTIIAIVLFVLGLVGIYTGGDSLLRGTNHKPNKLIELRENYQTDVVAH